MFKKVFAILFVQMVGISLSFALDLQLNNPPGDYKVYQWNTSRNTIDYTGLATRNTNGFKFTIPDEHVVKRGDQIDLKATLRKWRKDTPVADGNPRTRGGIGYYPFVDTSGKQHYLALEYLNERMGRYSGANISVGSSASVVTAAQAPALAEPATPVVEKPSVDSNKPCAAVEQELQHCKTKLHPGSSCPRTTAKLNQCLVSNGLKAAAPAVVGTDDVGGMPSKSTCSNLNNDKMCMMCNCFYEASTETDLGMKLVNDVVRTRARHKDYPRNICQVVHEDDQFSWTRSRKKRTSTIPKNRNEQATYNKCKRNVLASLNDPKGSQFAVNYHATYVNPRWARGCPVLKREKAHIFYKDCNDRSGVRWASNIEPSVSR
jgi:hypothetical protein